MGSVLERVRAYTARLIREIESAEAAARAHGEERPDLIVQLSDLRSILRMAEEDTSLTASPSGLTPEEERRRWWLIRIEPHYGDFPYYGTKAEANAMRAHKAAWEGETGRLEPLDPADPRVAREIARRKDDKARGVKLDERELEAIGGAS